MDYFNKIIEDIELHSVAGISDCFEHGISPNDLFRGEPLINELISEYTRSENFKACVQTFVSYGLVFTDKILLAVLADDAASLDNYLQHEPAAVAKKYSLRCAYTPLHEVTLLHICAEFNHVACAELLVKHGADVNAAAGLDSHGFGGQTPIFHTVNQNNHQSAAMLQYLLLQSADCTVTVRGLLWGKGYPWETFIPAVNPISYAMMGLLPQMHREERTVAAVVSLLCRYAYGISYTPANVPNTYLM